MIIGAVVRLYKFDDLSTPSKKRALKALRPRWVFDEAEKIGVLIKWYDLDFDKIDIELLYDVQSVLNKIEFYYKNDSKYMKIYNRIYNKILKVVSSQDNPFDTVDEFIMQFQLAEPFRDELINCLKSLYLRKLRSNLKGDAALMQYIRDNNIRFLRDGTPFDITYNAEDVITTDKDININNNPQFEVCLREYVEGRCRAFETFGNFYGHLTR